MKEFLDKYDDEHQTDLRMFEECGGRFLSNRDKWWLESRKHQETNCFLVCHTEHFPPSDEPAEYKNRGDLESEIGVRKACKFSRALLGPCSGLEDREFGFKEGKPCLIVKLNKIVNFRPRVMEAFFFQGHHALSQLLIAYFCTVLMKNVITIGD